MNTWYVTIKDITAYNGFGFKESGNTHWVCGRSSHYSFPFFPRFASWQVKAKSLMPRWSLSLLASCHVHPFEGGLTCLTNSRNVFLELLTCVTRYSSSCSAFGLGIAPYGHMSQPSNLSIVLAEISHVLGCKPQYSGCVNRWVVPFTSPVLMNYIIWCTPSKLLAELWTPTCNRWAYFRIFYASVDCRASL